MDAEHRRCGTWRSQKRLRPSPSTTGAAPPALSNVSHSATQGFRRGAHVWHSALQALDNVENHRWCMLDRISRRFFAQKHGFRMTELRRRRHLLPKHLTTAILSVFFARKDLRGMLAGLRIVAAFYERSRAEASTVHAHLRHRGRFFAQNGLRMTGLIENQTRAHTYFRFLPLLPPLDTSSSSEPILTCP
jgi:hypothetical protein